MAMMTCSGCGGFVPSAAASCPNCGMASPAPESTGYRLPRKVLAVLGGVAIPVTLMACYGTGPVSTPDAGKPDGGSTASDGGNHDAG